MLTDQFLVQTTAVHASRAPDEPQLADLRLLAVRVRCITQTGVVRHLVEHKKEKQRCNNNRGVALNLCVSYTWRQGCSGSIDRHVSLAACLQCARVRCIAHARVVQHL